jgi:hypothetical protein
VADVVILGAGGMGRGAAAWADDAGFTVLGFLSADASTVDTQVAGLPVLGGDDWLIQHESPKLRWSSRSARLRCPWSDNGRTAERPMDADLRG